MNVTKNEFARARRRLLRGLGRSALAATCWLGALAVGQDPVRAGQTRRTALSIQGRRVVGAGNVVRVVEGDQVELVWSTDEQVDLHLHGYDIELTVSPGAARTMSFEAYATGRFPVTSHGFGGEDDHDGHDTALIYLEVHPH